MLDAAGGLSQMIANDLASQVPEFIYLPFGRWIFRLHSRSPAFRQAEIKGRPAQMSWQHAASSAFRETLARGCRRAPPARRRSENCPFGCRPLLLSAQGQIRYARRW